MKFSFFLTLLLIVSSLFSCEKDQDFVYDPAHSNDPFYGTPFQLNQIPVPCSYEENRISSNYAGQPMELIISSNHTPYYNQEANWAIRGFNGGTQNVYVNFLQKPATGKYVTVNPNGQELSDDQCIVNGGFWVNTSLGVFTANADDTVYVNDLGQGRISVSFCNVHFKYTETGGGSSTIHQFDSGSGNLGN